ncbi:hypothetical protein CK203_057174 [Vitis vinifera]|uniref:Uncharacterized protein n=1 Tax=Vitis vinifera TaxID=29760 RepID=A0A438GKY2_VITVI|nr:hypothetical protein CK203_057174 [Vitis vinifera]
MTAFAMFNPIFPVLLGTFVCLVFSFGLLLSLSVVAGCLGKLLATCFCCPPASFVGWRFFFGVESRFWDGDTGDVGFISWKKCLRTRKRPHLAMRRCSCQKSVDKLSAKEFRERFCIPNGAVQRWVPVSPAVLFKEFLHFTQIPPAYIHPNMVRVLMGCSILNMLFNLDLSMLELVINLPDSTKGAAKGHVLVKGVWAGLAEHPDRPFTPNQSLKDKGGDWWSGWRRPQPPFGHPGASVVRAEHTPRRMLEEVVAGEHFVLQDLPFYAAVQKADARTRKARLTNRESRSSPLPSISSGPGHLAGLNHSGSLLLAVERLALLAEEATSINQPGSPIRMQMQPGLCAAASPLSAPQGKKWGQKAKVCLLAGQALLPLYW